MSETATHHLTTSEELKEQNPKPLHPTEQALRLVPGGKVEFLTFEQIFQRYAPYVLHVLPFLGIAAADVDDVCQDTFITVHDKLQEFEGRSTLRTWIYGICLRKAQNYRKRAFRRYEIPTQEIAERIVDEAPEEQLKQQFTGQMLDEALASLNQKNREVFVLYEIEELSMKEVADSVNCPLFTAYSRLYTARREMKKEMRRLSTKGSHRKGRSI